MSWLSKLFKKPLRTLGDVVGLGSVLVPGLGAAGILGKAAMAGKVAQGLTKAGAILNGVNAFTADRDYGNALNSYQDMINKRGGFDMLTPSEQALLIGDADTEAANTAGSVLDRYAGELSSRGMPLSGIGALSSLQADQRRKNRLAALGFGENRYNTRLGAMTDLLRYRQSDAGYGGESLGGTEYKNALADILESLNALPTQPTVNTPAESTPTGIDLIGLRASAPRLLGIGTSGFTAPSARLPAGVTLPPRRVSFRPLGG